MFMRTALRASQRRLFAGCLLRSAANVTRPAASRALAPYTSTRVLLKNPTTAPPVASPFDAKSKLTNEEIEKKSIVAVTQFNFEEAVLRSTQPTMLMFHVKSNKDVKEYTEVVKHQVTRRNKADGDITVRLCMVNIEEEQLIARQFKIDQIGVPCMFFLYQGQMLDRLVGVVQEEHIKQTIDALLKFIEDKFPGGKKPGAKGASGEKPQRMSEDEENEMTLLQQGVKKLQEAKDLPKAKALFEKVVALATPHVDKLKKDLGVGVKKVTPEILNKMKGDTHTQSIAKAMTMLAVCELTANNLELAIDYVNRLRAEYPWAIKDFKEVAESVAKIEMMYLSGYKANVDSYITLLKKDEVLDDPNRFYEVHLKLAVCHYLEKQFEKCVEELLKLIRAEQKLGLAPKRKGDTTPARQVIILVFDALGPDNPIVVDGRKKLSAFLFC